MDSPVADNAALADLSRWIAERTLAGDAETRMLEGVCERLGRMGVVLKRVLIGADTLHPVLEGRIFEWHRDLQDVREVEYGRTAPTGTDESWLRSPFHHLFMTGQTMIRRRLPQGPQDDPFFPVLTDLAANGTTDYVAYSNRLGGALVIGEMDAVFSSWTTDRAGGFSDSDLAALGYIVPAIASSILGSALGRIAGTLVETYLGRDAGRRVLRGTINRGIAERLHTVLWFSDLKGFTRLVDTVAPEQIIPLLNDYADAIVSSIHEHEGQVLKFIGDGLLATFEARDPAAACGRALEAARAALQRVEELNTTRTQSQLPVTGLYLALHVGEVFYGNIGSAERLDFTVIGPAVNEVSRIAGMSRSLDQDVLLSSAFAGAAGASREQLVSVGRYALRGIARPQELFTLDRSA
ncbi:MAG: adenylate/guanylate cyclase domain-containing protein [Dongiaceae bacterium]